MAVVPDRALVAQVYALIEQTGECERLSCVSPATNEISFGIAGEGEETIKTCLACTLDLITMLMRQGRLERV